MLDQNRLHLGEKLLSWYQNNGRDLPFRQTKDPYKIWISEVVFQQTRIAQGLGHYLRFIERFPTVAHLASSEEDEVLLYWKGLGYYSRAQNIHKAAKQIVNDFAGCFPTHYQDIISLKGVGAYTASAITSICFNEKRAAVDGNFYRILSRLFADDYEISSAKAFHYFSEIALGMMTKNPGDFNQAMMDLGSAICTPKNPKCTECPFSSDCLALFSNRVATFPQKKKKVKVGELSLHYFFVYNKNGFFTIQREEDFIWKKLYEFSESLPEQLMQYAQAQEVISHKLTHKNLKIHITPVFLPQDFDFYQLDVNALGTWMTFDEALFKTFPTPLERFIESKKNSL